MKIMLRNVARRAARLAAMGDGFSRMRRSIITIGIPATIVAALGPALLVSSGATTAALDIQLPACGVDPKANTLALQKAIDSAALGSNLVLGRGICVVAKCDYARGTPCVGIVGRHDSALYLGNRSDLTIVGAADGTSVLKLDPNPPRDSANHHGYCRDTHLLSIQGSSGITLRAFTVDGSDGELPEDPNQCVGNGGKIAEHMHGVYVLNSTNVVFDQMNITKAHGDGINLIANLNETKVPNTEHISITRTNFLANDRSGLGFQRNVGHVAVKGNYFKNSGDDQDLDMEATGGMNPLNVGPYDVEIDNNVFERLKPQLTVTLGSSGVQRSRGIRFTNNTIRPVANLPPNEGGGCIFIVGADNTTIANNTIIAGRTCIALEARKVSGLQIRSNKFEGYANIKNAVGDFAPRPVIRITEDVANHGDSTCGAPPKPPCPFFIHYPERVEITGNIILQHVQFSPAVDLDNVDPLTMTDNMITDTHQVPPAGNFDPKDPVFRPIGVDVSFGVQNPKFGVFENEKTVFVSWSITRNQLRDFADSIATVSRKAGMALSSGAVNNNLLNTSQIAPQGIWVRAAPMAPQAGYINNLSVNNNMFGCGFCGATCKPGGPPPSFAFVRPSGQAHTGNIGVTRTCQ